MQTQTVYSVEYRDPIIGAWFRYDDATTMTGALALVEKLRDGQNCRVRIVTTTTEEV